LAVLEEEGESANELPTVELDANNRFEWRNREPWAVVIRRRGKERKTVYTISKGGRYANEWKQWEETRKEYEANRANRTVGNAGDGI
jgi:hypothetical protein